MTSPPVSSLPTGKRPPLPELEERSQKLMTGRAQQEVKSAVHRELLTRIDLQKMGSLQDARARQQLLVLIHQLLSEQGIPLSVSERDRMAREVWTNCSAWARSSPCSRIQR